MTAAPAPARSGEPARVGASPITASPAPTRSEGHRRPTVRAAPATAPPEDLERHPLVRQALEVFGGRVARIYPKDQGGGR